MNHLHRLLVLSAAIFVLTGLSSPVYAALVQYTYTGNTFSPTVIRVDPDYGPLYGYPDGYSGGEHVSIKFTVDDSLVPKNGTFELPNSDPTDMNFPLKNFLITDGVLSIPTTNPYDYYAQTPSLHLLFDTDAEGNVSGRWDIAASQEFYDFRLYIHNLGSAYNNSPSPNLDYSENNIGIESLRYGLGSLNNPGTWTRTAVVPLPAGILLFGSALGGLCLIRRFSLARIRQVSFPKCHPPMK
ncbi:MAG: VPLPA-CTERM sorting domain-containing protein [Methylobacter sp.]|nr:VPLPA-CTERM sorting domain-containing protein [Methylobacter sp.]